MQNIGLFLQGIEKPMPGEDGFSAHIRSIDPTEQLVPYHKKMLLGLVKNLHIVHASSDRPMGKVFMLAQGQVRHMATLEARRGDILGEMDLSSWIMARGLNRSYWLRGAFKNLKSISFGARDSGRWSTYHEHDRFTWRHKLYMKLNDSESEGDDSGLSILSGEEMETRWKRTAERPACPDKAINDIIRTIFTGTGSLDICYHPHAFIELDLKSSKKRTLMVVHNIEMHSIPHRLNGLTRVYATTSTLQKHLHDDKWAYPVAGLILGFDSQAKPVFRLPPPPSTSDLAIEDEHALSRLRALRLRQRPSLAEHKDHWRQTHVEICLLPAHERDDSHLQLARDVRDALETFQKASRDNKGIQKYLGKLKIIVGDDIPACPCCGGKK